MKVIIVGGVAGGATAAARIRRLDEKASIVVYERSGYIPTRTAVSLTISGIRSQILRH